jgi:hypothetical protein
MFRVTCPLTGVRTADSLIGMLHRYRSDTPASPVDMVVAADPSDLLRCCSPSSADPVCRCSEETLELMRDFLRSRPHLHHNAGAAAENRPCSHACAARGPGADAAMRRGDWTSRYHQKAQFFSRTPGCSFWLREHGSILRRACEALGAEVRGIRRNPHPTGSPHPDMLPVLLADTDFLTCCLPLTRRPGT